MYQWLLFGHLIAVTALIGALGVNASVLLTLTRARTTAQVRALTGLLPTVEKIFPISTVALTGCGIGMVLLGTHDAAWSFGDAWIIAALVITVGMSVIGPTVTGARASRLAKAAAIAPDGPITNELARLARDPVMHSAERLGIILIAELMYLMASKPAATATLVSLLIAAALVAATTYSQWRHHQHQPAPDPDPSTIQTMPPPQP